jgi:hypothetical protein
MSYKIKHVEALPELKLKARFENGGVRVYDVAPLLEKFPVFETLSTTPGLFARVHIDSSGYGVVWNDEIDLAVEEIWINGIEVRPGDIS